MAYSDVVAYIDAVLLFHPMQNAVVLNIRIVAQANLVDITAEDSVHPHAGMFTDNHVADELRGIVNVASVGALGSDAFIGADHGFMGCCGRDAGYTILLNVGCHIARTQFNMRDKMAEGKGESRISDHDEDDGE